MGQLIGISNTIKTSKMVKTTNLLVFAIFQKSWANLLTLTQTLDEIQANSSNQRTFMAIEQMLINDVKRYGCWCYLDGNIISKGKAQPVDPIDESCKILAKGYECIAMDNPGCDGTTTDYRRPNIDFYSQVSAEFIRGRCLEANPSNNCEYSVCTVEQRFLTEYVNNAINGNLWVVHENYKHVGN